MLAASRHTSRDIRVDEIKTLVEGVYSQFGWKYEFEHAISKAEFVDATMRSLSEADGRRVEYCLNHRLLAIAYLKRSQWDTAHFGKTIAKLEGWTVDTIVDFKTRIQFLEKVKKAATDAGVKLIFARVPLADVYSVQAFEKVGAKLTDILLTFNSRIPNNLGEEHSWPKIESATKRDISAIESVAREVFTVDHFHADQQLDAKKSSEVFSKWVSNAFAQCPERLLVARKSGTPVGFILCGVQKLLPGYDVGLIDLVGVDSQMQGQGIGTALVFHALRWFTPRVGSVYVGTQAANSRALRLYQKCNFRHVFAEATFHLYP